MHNDDDLVTTAQAASALGTTRKGVRGAVDRGELVPVRKLPGQTGAYLFERRAVDALVEARKAATA